MQPSGPDSPGPSLGFGAAGALPCSPPLRAEAPSEFLTPGLTEHFSAFQLSWVRFVSQLDVLYPRLESAGAAPLDLISCRSSFAAAVVWFPVEPGVLSGSVCLALIRGSTICFSLITSGCLPAFYFRWGLHSSRLPSVWDECSLSLSWSRHLQHAPALQHMSNSSGSKGISYSDR